MDSRDSNMDNLENAIQYITREAVKNRVQTEVNVRTIATYAISRGLHPDHIDQLVHYVGNHQKGGMWLNTQVVRSLIPATNVPSSAALKAICYVGLRRIALNTKVLLLKWIILVYYLIDDLAPLRSLYGVILNHVTVDDLRPLICQLLYYLTRQEDVKPYRVQRLLQTRQRVGDEASLEALLTVYQLHAPHLVPVTIKPRKKWFNSFEKLLAANILKVQALQHGDVLQSPSLQHKDSVTIQPPNAKRRRTDVDVLFPKQMVDPRQDKNEKKITLTPLTSFSELLAHVDEMLFPSQMAVILQYPVMQQLFAISTDETATIRLTNWLQGVLLSEVIESCSKTVLPWIKSLFQRLVSLTHLILEPIPIVELFLADYLQIWDGCAYQKEILQLISCSLRLQHFDDLQSDFLDPLKKLMFTNELVDFKYSILQTLIELMRHFAIIEWPRSQRYLLAEDHSIERFESVFVMEYPDDLNPKNTIVRFVSYVDDLMIQCLQETNSDPFIQTAAASFHLMVARLPSDHNVPVFKLPSTDFYFFSLFSINPLAVTLACEHLVSFKKSLDLAGNWPVADRVASSTVQKFNHIVLGFCDALWRCLLFVEERQSNFKSLGFSFTNDQLIYNCKIKNPSERLHITQHTALLGYVSNFLSKIQTGERRMHPTMITHQRDTQQAYLTYLTLHHMDGIVNFLNTFTSR